MARVSWRRLALFALPLAGLIAAGIPAGSMLVGHPSVHTGPKSGVAGAEARYPAQTSSTNADGTVVTFSENVSGQDGGAPFYVVFARDLARGITQRVSRGMSTGGGAAVPGSGVLPYSVVSGNGRYVAFAQYVDVPQFEVLVYDLSTHTSRQVSVGRHGAMPDSHSFHPALSSDGSVVAFESAATNLVTGDTNDDSDIFVSSGGGIRRVSVGASGQGNGNSHLPAISADGRYVVFTSDADNLVPGDTNGEQDVFVRDLTYGITNRVSISTAARQADGASFDPAISADGRYVAYDSVASNLVAGDTNGTADVFVRDLRYGTTNRISRSGTGGQGNSYSSGPALSADGRYVAFTSAASNLVAGDSNARSDVFVRDVRIGATYRVSLGTADAQPDGNSTAASISADGQFVAFTSAGTNLVAGDANGVADGFVRDRWSRTTVRASVDADPF
ncbi:MAG: TolB protein [Mycobacteriales bacterium]|jgi:Tol biopolymer transport system component